MLPGGSTPLWVGFLHQNPPSGSLKRVLVMPCGLVFNKFKLPANLFWRMFNIILYI